jgi:hypothetical protein
MDKDAKISQKLENKTQVEKAEIKATEIAKINFKGETTKDDIKIEILETNKLKNGVEFLVKAWKNGQQLGFSKDGSVEIERIRIFNPPILIDDPKGDIVSTWQDEATGETKERRLKEDPEQAMKNILIMTVADIGKDGKNIEKGKVGQTTSKFFPLMDGKAQREVAAGGETWANNRDGAGTYSRDDWSPEAMPRIDSGTTNNYWRRNFRGFFHFDTDAIGSDTITGALIGIKGGGTTVQNYGTNTFGANIYESTAASDDAVVNADYGRVGTTEFSTTIDEGDWSGSDWNYFTLNASGIANINKSGVSKFATREANYCAKNTAPTWASGKNFYFFMMFAEEDGTDNDPYLQVEHSASAPTVVLNAPANGTYSENNPTLEFTGTDPGEADVTYEVQITPDPDFETDVITSQSASAPGFSNTVTEEDTDPFNSGEKIAYEIQ